MNRLRNFAPFNALLLHIQKPGLTHAATAREWWQEFGRVPKRHARPLIVLRAMGPVDFVFDVLDTEGRDLPEVAFTFPVIGEITQAILDDFLRRVRDKGIAVEWMDAGDAFAGEIMVQYRMSGQTILARDYTIALNQNHSPAQTVITLCHELAHLHLGHLGPDHRFKIPDRSGMSHEVEEIEAETVAFVIGHRNGIKTRSESYLDAFKGDFALMDFHAVMRAVNAIETLIGRPATKFRLGT